MSDSSNSPQSEVIAELTAYLDGELDNESVLRVEERLASDDSYRKQMQQLQKSWDILDLLPASSVNRSFTQSTMKLVVEDARKTAHKQREGVWTWPLRILALILVPAAASAGAFIANRQAQYAPIERLTNDLAIIKDLDVLACDESVSIELLEALIKQKSIYGMTSSVANHEQRWHLFNEPLKTIDALALLDESEKQRVRENKNRYSTMVDDKKKTIRSLHDQIENHDQRDRIRKALFEYCLWLDQQSTLDAAKVRDCLAVDAKLNCIRQIADEQFLPNFTAQLQDEDRKTVFLGLVVVTDQQRELIDERFVELFGPIELLNLPNDQQQLNDPNSKTLFSGHKLQRIYDRYPEVIDEIVSDDLVRLIKTTTLSPAAREVLELAREMANSFHFDKQISEGQLLTSWMLRSFEDFFGNKGPDLGKLFDSLPAAEQERLNNEFPEDRQRELLRIWKQRYGQGV